ncbi:sensor histidine kinase [Chryseobacterium sp. ERMR1:04]|uniref:sensor histidine kinase n=1 Tax=Chryseobacterium sp. ERMR1:04 TaxID=1705393 RepID=UPI0006C8A11F|nr:histidine kinase [Chryseobacterium sp. ERMR1:04]KPH15216.1 histidine kinase [Chryseobacterium sp. ERMR1:04]
MLKKLKKREKIIKSAGKKRVVIWFVSFVFVYLFSYLIDPFDSDWEIYTSRNWSSIIEDILWTLLLCVVLCEISLLIDSVLNKKFQWTEKPEKRLFLQAFFHVTASVAIVVIFNIIYLNPFEDLWETQNYYELTQLARWVATNIVISFIINAINTGNFLLNNWRATSLEAAQHKLTALQHKQAAMAAELQSLKLQIDPHFIFNNLSVLSELILQDQQLGYEYSENFAKVYRYLLVNSKKDIIALDDELKFLDSYIFLTKKRIGDGVVFTINVAEEFSKALIPPLTLQFLVENAIKHNQTTKTNPLQINIYTTKDKYLVVHNTLLPLLTKAESSGVGIRNIISRFELLSDRKPLLIKTEKDFIAKIPLL